MKILSFVFTLLLQFTITTKSFGANDQYYLQYCSPALASLSAGGISIVKPIQNGYTFNNNPASITKNNNSYYFLDAGVVNQGPPNVLIFNTDESVEEEIDNLPKRNKLYGYTAGSLGYLSSPKADRQDSSDDYFLFKNVKRNKIYWAAGVCTSNEELLYNIKRKSDNDDVVEGYSSNYDKILDIKSSFYMALGYKELTPGLDFGLTIARLAATVTNKYNYGIKEGSNGNEDSFGSYTDDRGIQSILASYGLSLGVAYNSSSIPALSVGGYS